MDVDQAAVVAGGAVAAAGAAPPAPTGYAAVFALAQKVGHAPPELQDAWGFYAWLGSEYWREVFAGMVWLTAHAPQRGAPLTPAERDAAVVWYEGLPKTLSAADWPGQEAALTAVRATIANVFAACCGAAMRQRVETALAANQSAVVRVPVAWLRDHDAALVGTPLARLALGELQQHALTAMAANGELVSDDLDNCDALFVCVTDVELAALYASVGATHGVRAYKLLDVPRLLRGYVDGGTDAFNVLGEAVHVVVPGGAAPVPMPLGGGWDVLDAVVAAQPGEGEQAVGINNECAPRMLAAAVQPGVAVPCKKHYDGTHVSIGMLFNTAVCRLNNGAAVVDEDVEPDGMGPELGSDVDDDEED